MNYREIPTKLLQGKSITWHDADGNRHEEGPWRISEWSDKRRIDAELARRNKKRSSVSSS